MAAELIEDEPGSAAHQGKEPQRPTSSSKAALHQDSDVEDDNEDEADEEPKLKYTRLTSSLAPVYRNGDATSTFMVAGDKMVGRMLHAASTQQS